MIYDIPLCSVCNEGLPEIKIDISKLSDIPEKLYPSKLFVIDESNIKLRCASCGKTFVVNEAVEI